MKDGMMSAVLPGYPFDKNAPRVLAEYAKESVLEPEGIPIKISIPPYTGTNQGVLDMKMALQDLKKDLAYAFVHGSLAIGEEIAYSDFDGLIVLKAEVFSNARRLSQVARKINQTRAIMLRIDPLQHHGWFVLNESDLSHYPETYLPSDVLKESRSLLSDKEETINLYPEQNTDYYLPLKELCRHLRKKTQYSGQPATLYQLKSFLSEFMMLPALYVQARDRKGIFKKYSFTEAAKDFKEEDWSIIEEVSMIRSQWPKEMSAFHRKKFQKIGYFWTQYRKNLGPGIPSQFKERLDQKFYERVASLANLSEVYVFSLDN